MTAEPRLIVVSGKGGVGKSAVAVATALAGHRSGLRVLVMSMIGTGGGVSSHLGAAPLTFQAREERPGLSSLVVDRTRALVEYLQVQVGLPPIIAIGPAMRAFDALASAAPAIREIVTLGKVLWEVRKSDWDLVVVDGPPTGQIASYLRAARTITELVPTGKIREQAGWMQEMLHDPAVTRLRLVTMPEELPVSETRETIAWLEANDVVTTVELVSNRVLPTLDVDITSLPEGEAGDAARLHLEIQAEQRRWLDDLPPDRTLPFLFGVMTPSEVSARMADELEDWR